MTNPSPKKLDKPEFLLFFVVVFMLWSVGFVDLLTHISGTPETAVFGLYSRSVFVVLIGYGTLFFGWLGLLLWPKSHLLLPAQIRRLQEATWPVIILLAAFGFLLWNLLTHYRWRDFPGLRLSLFLFFLLSCAILILANWRSNRGPQLWRKLILYPLILLVIAELGVQGVAWAGMLPNQVHINTGLFASYGRIYQNEEGFANAITNNYGWYYPDFRLRRGESRVMLLGDSYIQALQIQPEEHMGVVLENLIHSLTDTDVKSSPEETEVLALGMPGFGPGLYLSDTRLADAIQVFRPQEIILFVHLANDFNIASGPDGYQLFHTLDPEGRPIIHEESWQARHNLQHYILHGYEYDIDLVKTLKSHILLPKVLGQLNAYASTSPTQSEGVAEIDPMTISQAKGAVLQEVELPGDFNDIRRTQVVANAGTANLLFERASSEDNQLVKHAFATLEGLILAAHEQLDEQGVTLRLVTIPAFPAAFFDSAHEGAPQTQIGELDLLLPEKHLQQFAEKHQIPFLATGEVLLQRHWTTEQIQALFFRQGTGHLTPAGHQMMGELMAECFYEYQPDSRAHLAGTGCYTE